MTKARCESRRGNDETRGYPAPLAGEVWATAEAGCDGCGSLRQSLDRNLLRRMLGIDNPSRLAGACPALAEARPGAVRRLARKAGAAKPLRNISPGSGVVCRYAVQLLEDGMKNLIIALVATLAIAGCSRTEQGAVVGRRHGRYPGGRGRRRCRRRIGRRRGWRGRGRPHRAGARAWPLLLSRA